MNNNATGIAHNQSDLEAENTRLRTALDDLLDYVSGTKEAENWDSNSTPDAVVAAVAALCGIELQDR